MSPSVWRVWIEMAELYESYDTLQSPSVWRVWIEIGYSRYRSPLSLGHPPCGGCGLKLSSEPSAGATVGGHPPCGGCGLKSQQAKHHERNQESPSVWRVWIEIFVAVPWLRILLSPSVWRVWIEIVLGAF